ncbi:uncharacterized protein AB675_5636 [Cyphellophora attinorum]|uniref:Carbonic anhydrase n=1 Tax=Cyphellophora attinorum TaxID=1664694 RepID=A0A0N0NNT5_9EURO|nr:uncharacterized protein AB675_5636 [Phialophora attinorum]KPI41961.1 hypothetical protein AB675_5636 [Phialophora attinorum]
MSSPIVDELLRRNKEYADSVHKPLPLLHGSDGKLRQGSRAVIGQYHFPSQRRPRKSDSTMAHTYDRLSVTCADPRIIPESFLGFRLPNNSPMGRLELTTSTYLAIPVIRVIGGRAIHAIENIVGLDAAFGVDTVVLVHHKDCGLTHFDEARLKATLRKRFPEQGAMIETIAFGAIGKLGQSLVDDAVFIKQHPLVRGEVVVKGFMYDIEGGLLEEVV